MQKICAQRGKALLKAFICGDFGAARARFLGVVPKIEAIRGSGSPSRPGMARLTKTALLIGIDKQGGRS